MKRLAILAISIMSASAQADIYGYVGCRSTPATALE
jgi:hypothetical protein